MFAFIIDADTDTRDMLGLRLSKAGYDIMAFCTYVDACELLREGACPRIIIGELRVPGPATAQEFGTLLRVHSADACFIIYSSDETLSSDLQVYSADFFVRKPHDALSVLPQCATRRTSLAVGY